VAQNMILVKLCPDEGIGGLGKSFPSLDEPIETVELEENIPSIEKGPLPPSTVCTTRSVTSTRPLETERHHSFPRPCLPPALNHHSADRVHPLARHSMPTPAAKIITLLAISICTVAGGDQRRIDQRLTFERDIRPIFRAHCFDCHGATDELEGGLDLRLVRLMEIGGESGSAITPGDSAGSYLFQRVRAGEMPPGQNRLSDDETRTLQRWIADGAPTARPEPESIGSGVGITPEERSFWSFQPIRRPEVPRAPTASSVRTPIDAFLLRAMPNGLAFAPDADRLTLIKRLYFDLIGLPPSPDELERWMSVSDDAWFEKLVDELLNSPHYGERWARHWLDVAGYADSEGYHQGDAVRPSAWKYRDYVIRSLNDDKPFDRFLLDQLAGDELAGAKEDDWTPEQIELLTAVGFLRMAADGTGQENTVEARNQVVSDTLKIVSTALLGLTVGCAQCHDHRYDPIPQTDYYSLRAIFEPALDYRNWQTPSRRRISLMTEVDRGKANKIEKEARLVLEKKKQKLDEFISTTLEEQLKKVPDIAERDLVRVAYRTPADKRTDEQKQLLEKHPSVLTLNPRKLYLYSKERADKLKEFDKQAGEIRAKKPPQEFVRALVEPAGHLPETNVFFRGEPDQPRENVLPAALTVVSPPGERHVFTPDDELVPTSGRRLAFARWLTSGQHPLVARVTVNRVWMHHFGRGLVATPGDFGKLGARPTHPELLDWLADEFMAQGWSLKQLHRVILKSTAWRQAASQPVAFKDSTNRYYTRWSVTRLDAESIRDRMLAAAGQLTDSLFGSPLAIAQDDTGQVEVTGEQDRRSLYIQVRRSQPVAMLQSFDAPVMETNCDRRPVSTVATQSLMLLNGNFILRQASQLAERVARKAKLSSEGEMDLLAQPQPPIAQAWQLALCRQPSEDELQLAATFVARQLKYLQANPDKLPKNTSPAHQVMTNLCQVLMGSNEFLYVN